MAVDVSACFCCFEVGLHFFPQTIPKTHTPLPANVFSAGQQVSAGDANQEYTHYKIKCTTATHTAVSTQHTFVGCLTL